MAAAPQAGYLDAESPGAIGQFCRRSLLMKCEFRVLMQVSIETLKLGFKRGNLRYGLIDALSLLCKSSASICNAQSHQDPHTVTNHCFSLCLVGEFPSGIQACREH